MLLMLRIAMVDVTPAVELVTRVAPSPTAMAVVSLCPPALRLSLLVFSSVLVRAIDVRAILINLKMLVRRTTSTRMARVIQVIL